MKKRPIAIDLFAGAGGLSLGLEQAGFDVVASVEIDPVHCCVHQFNFPQCAILPKPVEQVSASCLRQAANLNAQENIDLIAGGAPCQGFSLMGQRALDDPRNQLIKEFIRVINDLRPSYFLFENVKGLTVGKHKKFLEEIIQELESIGYQVRKPWKVLNAKDFGVPQNRERLFLLGANKSLPVPDYPNHILSAPISCSEALSDLPDAESFDELINTDEVSFRYLKQASGYSSLMRCTTDKSWKYGRRRSWNPNILTSSLRTNHTDMSRNRFKATLPGTIEKVSRFYKLSESGISNTLRAGTDSARGSFTSPRPIHFKYSRCITVREMARLHGFPDWFRFHETKWHGARQIGNAVPPPLAFALGREIARLINPNLEQCKEILSLGDDDLLRMDVSSASKYWGITNPIARRDRKWKTELTGKVIKEA